MLLKLSRKMEHEFNYSALQNVRWWHIKGFVINPPHEITLKSFKHRRKSWELKAFMVSGVFSWMTMMTMVVWKRAKSSSFKSCFFIFSWKAWNEYAVTLQNVYNEIVSFMNYVLNNLQNVTRSSFLILFL